jgi:hypothetical protein
MLLVMASDCFFVLFQNDFWRRTSFLSRVAIRVRNLLLVYVGCT